MALLERSSCIHGNSGRTVQGTGQEKDVVSYQGVGDRSRLVFQKRNQEKRRLPHQCVGGELVIIPCKSWDGTKQDKCLGLLYQNVGGMPVCHSMMLWNWTKFERLCAFGCFTDMGSMPVSFHAGHGKGQNRRKCVFGCFTGLGSPKRALFECLR